MTTYGKYLNPLPLAYAINQKADEDNKQWMERVNQLLGLSIIDLQAIFDYARCGNYARLQLIYRELEASDPTLFICVQRRISALSSQGWRIVPNDQNDDSDETQAQLNALKERYNRIDNIVEAIEHLELSFFRGYAHVSPRFDADGEILSFDLPDNVNFCRNLKGQWFWNPNAIACDPNEPGFTRLTPLEPDSMISVENGFGIDYPALAISIRARVGEMDWGRYVERFGIPPVILTKPPDTNTEIDDAFRDAAKAMHEGSSASLPSGSIATFGTTGAGVGPFEPFISHQQKLLVLLSTGGTLTSISESGSGTLAGNAQMDVWRQIVARDAVKIGKAIDRFVSNYYLDRLFPGQVHLVHFEIGNESDRAANEVFDTAARARNAGYRIDQRELEQASGWTLKPMDEAAPAVLPNIKNEKTINEHGDEITDEDILAAFAEDVSPVAEKIRQFIAADEEGKKMLAKDLADEIPSSLPDEPEFADMLVKAMYRSFESGKGE